MTGVKRGTSQKATLPEPELLREGPEPPCHQLLQVATLDPATHAYSFWEGVPAEGRYAFGRLFSQSYTLQVTTPDVSAKCLPGLSAIPSGLDFYKLVLISQLLVCTLARL